MTATDTKAPYILTSTLEEVEEARRFYEDWCDNMTDKQKAHFAELDTALDLEGEEEDPTKQRRCFKFAQYIDNPLTGGRMYAQELLDAGIEALQAQGILDKYAFAYHHSDTEGGCRWELEQPDDDEITPLHVHVNLLLKPDTRMRIRTLGDLFSVPPSRFRIITKKDEYLKFEKAFLDVNQYLCHLNKTNLDARDAGKPYKYIYDPREVVANFDFAEYLETEPARLYPSEGTDRKKSALRKEARKLVHTGTPVWQVKSDPKYYDIISDETLLRGLYYLRRDYMMGLPSPLAVTNFYISGQGGMGKDLMARALARSLFPETKKPRFRVGGGKVAFERYDGEPVLHWEDWRAGELLKLDGGRGNLFRVVFGPHREEDDETTVHIKGHHTRLLNTVNIITGPDDYRTFIEGLAGQYTSRDGIRYTSENLPQSYRRFPIIIPVDEEQFSLLVNKGWLNDTAEYEEYEHFGTFRQQLGKLKRTCQSIADAERRQALQLTVERQTVAPIVEQYNRLTIVEPNDKTDAELEAQFAGAGELIESEIAEVVDAEIVEAESAVPDFELELKELRGLNAGLEKQIDSQSAEIIKLRKELAASRDANRLMLPEKNPYPNGKVPGIVVP